MNLRMILTTGNKHGGRAGAGGSPILHLIACIALSCTHSRLHAHRDSRRLHSAMGAAASLPQRRKGSALLHATRQGCIELTDEVIVGGGAPADK